MVQIYFYEGGGVFRIDMQGHGDLANMEGLDVMCAASTTLANSLALMVMTFNDSEMLGEEPTVYIGDDGEGKAQIIAKPKPNYHNIVKSAFETAAIGFLHLSVLYPEKIEYIRE